MLTLCLRAARSRGVRFALGCLAAFGAAACPAQPPGTPSPAPAAWSPAPGKLMTRWAAEVDPAAPWPEYPRPTMVRERWQNLNGLWDYAIAAENPPALDGWQGRILVPFPLESALSGVGKSLTPEQTLHYRRTFRVPADWRTDGQRVLLHFGAVDWHAKVRVNGHDIGTHKGGYDPFSFDITDALKPADDEDNELTVHVTDPTNTGGQPRGKQWNKPHGIWYTPTSGIWQTVWMEPVSNVRIDRIDCVSSDVRPLDPTKEVGPGRRYTGKLRVFAKLAKPSEQLDVEFIIDRDGQELHHAITTTGKDNQGVASMGWETTFEPWSPTHPNLYGVTVRLRRGDVVLDEARSYAAVREVAVAKDRAGINRLMLNGEPLFHFGPLDQGFWPDGLYTAPTLEAMKFDIDAVKKMGCNMLRKHVKVEPELFYYWCDKLGVMVWQDMPSPFFETLPKGNDKGWDEDFPPISDEWKSNFKQELFRLIQSRRHHPSIVMWVPFNEGWGQNDLAWAKSMVEFTKIIDPTRLVNNASGWTDMKAGDVMDIHVYPGPAMAPVEESRASVLGEFGGLGLPLSGHTWTDKNNWGYVSFKDSNEVTEAYLGLIKKLRPLVWRGLSAAVYTQTTDVEIEVNGWLTYDRAEWKINPERVAESTRALYAPSPVITTLVPHAGNAGKNDAPTWWSTTAKPADDWMKPEFKPGAEWKQARAGFGTAGTPGAVVGTTWNTGDIWIRRSFDLDREPRGELWLAIHHDEDAEIFINGVPAATLTRWSDGYTFEPISPEARASIKKGANTIAIHCRQTSGGQNIDAGVVEFAARD